MPSLSSSSVPVANPSAVPSPCRSLCKLDEDRVFCQGCGRTLDDIRQWRTMDDDARRACVQRAAEQRAAWGQAD